MDQEQQDRKIRMEWAKRIQGDPMYFINTVLKAELWEKQRLILQSLFTHKRVAVRSCHGAGKSFVASCIVLWFLYTHVNSKVITTAPSFRQVEDILWREIHKSFTISGQYLEGQLNKTSLDIGADWFALGLSTDLPDRFQGFHAVDILLIVDEAAGVKEDIFEASEGITSSAGGKVLYIGNPTNLAGSFYNAFKSNNYVQIHISAFDTPNFTKFGITPEDIRKNIWKDKITGELPRPYLITPEWVYDKFVTWGEDNPMYQARVMGNFPQQGEDTLIPLIKIEQATLRTPTYKDGDVENTGADIARFGTDKTIFIYRKGNTAVELKEFRQMDTKATSNALINFLAFHPQSGVNIDEIGVGAGVVDNAKADRSTQGKSIQGINVGIASQNPEMFYNLRAEIYWGLRERFIKDDIVIPADQELMAQLANIKFKFTPRGQILIESKEDMKKRGLPSPDKADALALAFYKGADKPALLQFLSQS